MTNVSNFFRSLGKWISSHKLIAGIILVVVAGGIVLYRRSAAKASGSPTYTTAQVTKGTLVVSVTGSGKVASTNNLPVTTQASGVISKMYVKEGDTVKAGQALAKIDLDMLAKQRSQQSYASYLGAKNSLASAQANLYSAQSKEFSANQIFINGAVVRNLDPSDPTYIEQDADWLAAEAAYKNQQAAITQAQISLSQAYSSYQQNSDTIYAPISGKITGWSLQVGNVISDASLNSTSTSNASTKVANVTTDAKPILSVDLTEIDIPKIKTGDLATITIDSLGTQTYVGKVVSVDNVGGTSSNVTSYPVTIQLDDENPAIFANMAVNATIQVESKSDVLIVPNSAVTTANGTSTVQIMKNGQPQTVPVTTGLTSDSETEITSGLNEGDTIVTATIQPTGSKTTTSTGTSPFSALGGGANRGFGGAGGATTVVRRTGG